MRFFSFFFSRFLEFVFLGGLFFFFFFSQGWICPWHFDARQRGTMLLQICSICTIGFKNNTTQKKVQSSSLKESMSFPFSYVLSDV